MANNDDSGCGCGGGIFSAGGVLGMVISYHLGNTLGWVIIHGLFGWFYVIYALLTQPIFK